MEVVDIRTADSACEILNAILNNGGIAEVKLEGKDRFLTIVESKRSVRFRESDKESK